VVDVEIKNEVKIEGEQETAHPKPNNSFNIELLMNHEFLEDLNEVLK